MNFSDFESNGIFVPHIEYHKSNNVALVIYILLKKHVPFLNYKTTDWSSTRPKLVVPYNSTERNNTRFTGMTFLVTGILEDHFIITYRTPVDRTYSTNH